VMVGPVVKIDAASLPLRTNIHYFGQRSYAELPGFLAGWDVCLGELDKVVQGEQAQGPHAVPMTAWKAVYQSYVRSGMPAGAPVPD